MSANRPTEQLLGLRPYRIAIASLGAPDDPTRAAARGDAVLADPQPLTRARSRFVSPPLRYVVLAAALAGCREASPAPPRQAPPEVSVVTVASQTTEEPLEFEGQVRASRTVQVRAQVAGVVTARPFTEGAPVRAGDVLTTIDVVDPV
ncbi:MAG: hypothetical protein AVDCRST_MAG40-188, partial [uncultured Gemmatimonadaceae bacterium]